MTDHAVSQLRAVRLLLVAAKAPAHIHTYDRTGLCHLADVAVAALAVQVGGDDVNPSWSPTSDTIAFLSDRDGDWEIYTVQADGTGLNLVSNSPSEERNVAWSPDDTRLVSGSNDDTARVWRTWPDLLIDRGLCRTRRAFLRRTAS